MKTVKTSILVVTVLAAGGIGTWIWWTNQGGAPNGRASALPARTVAAAATADQGPSAIASAPDPSAYDVQLKPPRTGQSPSDNHVLVLQGALRSGVPEAKSFTLPKLAGMSVLLMGDGVRYSFRSPSGTMIVPGESKESPGYRFVSGEEGAGFTLEHPEQGTWTVTIASVGSGRGVAYGIDIRADGSADEAAHLETLLRDSDPNMSFLARPGDPVFVRVFVATSGRPVKGVQWDIRARSPNGNLFTIPVYDDGRHADGDAHDGISVGAIVADGPDGFYEVRATGHAPSGVDYVVTGTIEVQAQNDLLIADEIEVAPEHPKAGEPVTLTVTVRNAGTVDSRNVELEFYLGARKESGQTFDLRAGESRRIATTWVPGTANNFDVQLTIDPDTEPYASNFENNTRRAVVQVRE